MIKNISIITFAVALLTPLSIQAEVPTDVLGFQDGKYYTEQGFVTGEVKYFCFQDNKCYDQSMNFTFSKGTEAAKTTTQNLVETQPVTYYVQPATTVASNPTNQSSQMPENQQQSPYTGNPYEAHHQYYPEYNHDQIVMGIDLSQTVETGYLPVGQKLPSGGWSDGQFTNEFFVCTTPEAGEKLFPVNSGLTGAQRNFSKRTATVSSEYGYGTYTCKFRMVTSSGTFESAETTFTLSKPE